MAEIDENYHKLLETILKDGFKYEDPNRKDINRIQIPTYTFEHDFKDGFPAITTKKLYWKGVVGELLWFLRGDTSIKYLLDNNINIWNKDAYNYYLKQCKNYNVKPVNDKEFLYHVKNKTGRSVWGNNNYKLGDLGRIYGAQLRNWQGISNELVDNGGDCDVNLTNNVDQFAELINTLKTNPMATKKTVTFWNPAEKDQCALTPCHWSFEVLVEPLSLSDRIHIYVNKFGSTDGTEKEMNNANIPKYQFTLKWHQHSVDTFLGR